MSVSHRNARQSAGTAPRRELSVYDGRNLLGHVREEGGRCRATTWPDGRDLGEFPNRKAAADAIGAGQPRELSILVSAPGRKSR
jgi:hypothetical protein